MSLFLPEAENLDTITCWHGTSRANLTAATNTGGLTNPYVTPDPDLAWHYAEQAADDTNTEPVLVTLTIPATQLRYDGAAMDEPVLTDDTTRDAAWNAAAAAHPNWVTNNTITCPPDAWTVSWTGVRSAWVDGTVAAWQEDEDV